MEACKIRFPWAVANVGRKAKKGMQKGNAEGLMDTTPGAELCGQRNQGGCGSKYLQMALPSSSPSELREARSWEKYSSTLLPSWLGDPGQVPSSPHLLPGDSSLPLLNIQRDWVVLEDSTCFEVAPGIGEGICRMNATDILSLQ